MNGKTDFLKTFQEEKKQEKALTEKALQRGLQGLDVAFFLFSDDIRSDVDVFKGVFRNIN